jgi:hypothetical protein
VLASFAFVPQSIVIGLFRRKTFDRKVEQSYEPLYVDWLVIVGRRERIELRWGIACSCWVIGQGRVGTGLISFIFKGEKHHNGCVLSSFCPISITRVPLRHAFSIGTTFFF